MVVPDADAHVRLAAVDLDAVLRAQGLDHRLRRGEARSQGFSGISRGHHPVHEVRMVELCCLFTYRVAETLSIACRYGLFNAAAIGDRVG